MNAITMGDIGTERRRVEVLPATKPVRAPRPAPAQPAPVKTPAKEPVPAGVMQHADIPRAVVKTIPIPRGSINAERFYSHTDRQYRRDDECWTWNGIRDDYQYGRSYLTVAGRKHRVAAHRVSYVLAHGQIPDGLVVDHLCRNKSCVNPRHLEAVTSQVNTARGSSGTRAQAWLEGKCINGHDLAAVGVHKKAKGWTCAQCGRDRVARYKLRKTQLRTPA